MFKKMTIQKYELHVKTKEQITRYVCITEWGLVSFESGDYVSADEVKHPSSWSFQQIYEAAWVQGSTYLKQAPLPLIPSKEGPHT